MEKLMMNISLSMKKAVFSLFTLMLAVCVSFAGKDILELKGAKGPGKGKTIVLVAGDEEELIEFIRNNRPYPQITLIHENVMGYNILAFGKVYYAMPQQGVDQEIFEKVSEYETEETAQKVLQNDKVIVSQNRVSLLESIKEKYGYPVPQLLEENVGGFNIVGYHGMFYAIKRGANIEVDKLEKEFIKSSDNILVAKELTILKNLIR